MVEPSVKLLFRSGTRALAAKEPSQTTIAVDLGFAKSRASCGLAWKTAGVSRSGTFAFGDCVSKVAALLGHPSDADLIIEAPLSGFFSTEGNPIERGPFERREATETERTQTRYWYSGPGAATCLGAVFFLRALLGGLKRANSDRPLRLTLFEGFLTFKASGTDHERDAKLLLDAFLAGGDELSDLDAPEGSTAISILDVVASAAEQRRPPALVIPAARRVEAG